MRRRLRLDAALAAACTLTAGATLAQRPDSTRRPTAPAATSPARSHGRLVGVFDGDSGEPLDSAEVRDMVTGRAVRTTRAGTVALSFVDSAGSLIQVRKLGYTPAAMFIRNLAVDTTPVTIVLTRASQVTLPTVVTRDSAPYAHAAALRGFDERRRQGVGYFVTEEELRQADGRALRDLLRSRIPGTTITQMSAAGRRAVAYFTSPRGGTIRGGPICYPDVLVDGVPAIKTGPAPDLNDFSVDQFAAIEFYNVASVPPQFNATGSGCGVLLLWTRTR